LITPAPSGHPLLIRGLVTNGDGRYIVDKRGWGDFVMITPAPSGHPLLIRGL